ncbi:purine-binding chemotaxis protein CheW [Sphaerotilus hippei]|uniref:Chemotaxis protein CheW n=1 Tax=Sphaerotilus hippei TaxID=744406 RepID=A0A318H4N4_9BURK|nr:chemotaxis protein CheW [Sphaerotilus hippei]PXW96166.1 purine-binding chemotaxis protein CheW [Sphaerotilus hippei]
MSLLHDAPVRQMSSTSFSSASAKRTAAAAAGGSTTLGGEFLTFRLGQEEYGIDILKVQEIRSYEQPTRIANAPPFLKGVVNLRGVIVPVLDLRIKLGCETAEVNAITVVIVLNMRGRVVGAVVDSVSDVLQIDAQMVQPAPEMSAMVDMRFIQGIANVGERMLILMDIESILSSTELGALEAAF